MQILTDKYKAFGQHTENMLTDTTKQTGKATLTGNYYKFIDMTAVLQYTFFVCVLISVNTWRDTKSDTYTCNTDTVDTVQCKKNFERKKCQIKHWSIWLYLIWDTWIGNSALYLINHCSLKYVKEGMKYNVKESIKD